MGYVNFLEGSGTTGVPCKLKDVKSYACTASEVARKWPVVLVDIDVPRGAEWMISLYIIAYRVPLEDGGMLLYTYMTGRGSETNRLSLEKLWSWRMCKAFRWCGFLRFINIPRWTSFYHVLCSQVTLSFDTFVKYNCPHHEPTFNFFFETKRAM